MRRLSGAGLPPRVRRRQPASLLRESASLGIRNPASFRLPEPGQAARLDYAVAPQHGC